MKNGNSLPIGSQAMVDDKNNWYFGRQCTVKKITELAQEKTTIYWVSVGNVEFATKNIKPCVQ